MYTDKFFRFPIKIYDGFSARQAERSEDSMGMPVEVEWHEGIAVLPMGEFTSSSVYWYQSFSSGHDVGGFGFNTTTICSDKFGSFTCTWTLDKFERELNKFMEQFEIKLEND